MDSALFIPRILDAVRLCDASSMPKFVGFLTPAEAAEADNAVKKLACTCSFFGGYKEAERVYFGVFPDWCEDREDFFPISPLTFTFRACDRLTHRDFLGALMSLGIVREAVGDILIEEGRTVVFLNSELSDFVSTQLTKVGRVGVKCEKSVTLPLPGGSKLEPITDTVASTRLDCVVASLARCSRGQAAELIADGLVTVNSFCVTKAVKTVYDGDRISIRGKGRFLIDSVSGRSKKDRVILLANKYL